jgi:hypothetical protein
MNPSPNSQLRATRARKAAEATCNEAKNVRQKSMLLRYVADSTIERSHQLKARESARSNHQTPKKK